MPNATAANSSPTKANGKKPAAKRGRGRPKASPDDLPKGWQKILLDCYREGGSDVQARCALGDKRPSGTLSIDLWDRWIQQEPEFSETIKTGRELAEKWWMDLGQDLATGAVQGSNAVYIFNLKNRFGWRDVKQHEHSGDISHSHEHTVVSETDRRIGEMLGTGQSQDSAPASTH